MSLEATLPFEDLLARADARQAAGEMAAAWADYAQVLEQAPNNGEICRRAAGAARHAAGLDQAEALLRRAVALAPENAQFRIDLVGFLVDHVRGHRGEVENELEFLCAQLKGVNGLYGLLGRIKKELLKYHEAAAALETELALEP